MTDTGSTDAVVLELEQDHRDDLIRFFAALPEGDRTFIREEVTDPDVVRSLTSTPNDRRWVARGDGGVVAYVAVRRLPGWSDHVGEIRLVVAADQRGTGLGRVLARHAMTRAVTAGMTKLVVEVVADQGAPLALFTHLGFSGEALLENHIRDRQGQLRDLMVLAHHVEGTWSRMGTLGIADGLGGDIG